MYNGIQYHLPFTRHHFSRDEVEQAFVAGIRRQQMLALLRRERRALEGHAVAGAGRAMF